MAKKRVAGYDSQWELMVGVQDAGPNQCKTDGTYTHVMDPHDHTDEYAGNAFDFSGRGPETQKSYPSGRRYGPTKGSGKKKAGSDGSGLYGKMHKRSG